MQVARDKLWLLDPPRATLPLGTALRPASCSVSVPERAKHPCKLKQARAVELARDLSNLIPQTTLIDSAGADALHFALDLFVIAYAITQDPTSSLSSSEPESTLDQSQLLSLGGSCL